MSVPAVAVGRSAARVGTRARALAVPAWLAPALIVALAGVLRLVGMARMPDDPFYDAAVRTMGGSWHAFFTGAIDPSTSVSVDKPPMDLWFQVASTKVLGFETFGLHLPEAVGGTLAVLALYDLLKTLFGRGPALAGAATLAVLPMAVITSRSDTMDSMMAALVILAAALTARAARNDRPALLVIAGAVLGLAFQVKLFEALIGAPALIALWWLGSTLPRPRRAGVLAVAGGAFVVVALAWLIALPLLGGAHRPWAFGSTDGSAWNATFVYDGLHRLTGFPPTPRPHVPAGPGGTARELAARTHQLALLRHRRVVAQRLAPGPPSPWRLFTARDGVGLRTGIALALALLALVAATISGAFRRLDRLGRAGALALVGWFGTGVVLFSAQHALKPRYLEAVDPALAAVLGVGLVLAARGWSATAPPGRPSARTLAAGALAVALLAPAAVSVAAVADRTEDAGAPGALAPARLAVLATYLRAHQDGAPYAAAAMTVGTASSLIAGTGLPVRVLAANDARPLTSVPALAHDIAVGQVRTVLLGAPCARFSPDVFTGCSPLAAWVRAHGIDVSRAAGQPYPGFVYAFRGGRDRIRIRSRSGAGSPTSARSTRTHAHRSRRPRPATRAPHRRSARARRRFRSGTGSSAAR